MRLHLGGKPISSRRYAVLILIGLAVVVGGLATLIALRVARFHESTAPVSTADRALPAKQVLEKQPSSLPRPKSVLKSSLPGRWYEADGARLARQIDDFLANAKTDRLENVLALILPHAGYAYSGQTAAYAVKTVAGRSFHRVVVLGPTHRVPMENVASVPDVTHYVTPLGEVPLDVAFIAALLQHPCFQSIPEAHEYEHSVQIEIPLLQRALGEFELVPIVCGQLDRETTQRMAAILRALVDESTLVVASSDFTHFGARFDYYPFRDNVPENLRNLDMGAFELIQNKDADGFFNYVARTGATICGRCPIAVLLAMLPDDATAHLMHYDTSGGMTNDYSSSVSYLSVAFSGAWPAGNAETLPLSDTALDGEDCQQLLRLARETLAFYFKEKRVPTTEELDIPITPYMKTPGSCFVTLEEAGQLRGCIGNLGAYGPLYKSVMANTLSAAFRDRRFAPVSPGELADLHFEISVLTPMRPVASYEEIEIGKHGILLEKGGNRAVFLPQVAPEQGWGLEETLAHLSLKAGLPPDAWREGASFAVFEAIVFEENEG